MSLQNIRRAWPRFARSHSAFAGIGVRRAVFLPAAGRKGHAANGRRLCDHLCRAAGQRTCAGEKRLTHEYVLGSITVCNYDEGDSRRKSSTKQTMRNKPLKKPSLFFKARIFHLPTGRVYAILLIRAVRQMNRSPCRSRRGSLRGRAYWWAPVMPITPRPAFLAPCMA